MSFMNLSPYSTSADFDETLNELYKTVSSIEYMHEHTHSGHQDTDNRLRGLMITIDNLRGALRSTAGEEEPTEKTYISDPTLDTVYFGIIERIRPIETLLGVDHPNMGTLAKHIFNLKNYVRENRKELSIPPPEKQCAEASAD